MQLIDRLYDSIRPGHERAIERKWAAESERRINAYERGEADTISYEEMKRELREREG
jgi:putative addiction module component (TIGR02574 family)